MEKIIFFVIYWILEFIAKLDPYLWIKRKDRNYSQMLVARMSMHDSIETSVAMKIFPSKALALRAHSLARFTNLPMTYCCTMENLDPIRMSPTPYPAYDRPRGKEDMASVNFHRKQLRNGEDLEPIWVARVKNKLVLLDGAHRIAASNLEDEKTIPAYVITVT